MENRLGTFTSPSGGYNRGCPWWNCMERWNKWNGWISTLASAASNMVIERYIHTLELKLIPIHIHIYHTIHNSMFICNGHCCQRVRLSSRRLGCAGRLSWWCGVVHPSCRTYRKVPKLSPPYNNNIHPHAHTLFSLSCHRYKKGGQALLLLLPSEQKMTELLTGSKIPVNSIQVNPKKLHSIESRLQAAIAEDPTLQYLARKVWRERGWTPQCF